MQDVDTLYCSNKMNFIENMLYLMCHGYNFMAKLLQELNLNEESTHAKKEAKFFYRQFKQKQDLKEMASQKSQNNKEKLEFQDSDSKVSPKNQKDNQ